MKRPMPELGIGQASRRFQGTGGVRGGSIVSQGPRTCSFSRAKIVADERCAGLRHGRRRSADQLLLRLTRTLYKSRVGARKTNNYLYDAAPFPSQSAVLWFAFASEIRLMSKCSSVEGGFLAPFGIAPTSQLLMTGQGCEADSLQGDRQLHC